MKNQPQSPREHREKTKTRTDQKSGEGTGNPFLFYRLVRVFSGTLGFVFGMEAP
jgi:hypothetical protein